MKRLGVVVVLLLVAALPASAARLPVTAPHDWWPVSSPDSKLVAFTQVNGQGRLFTLEVFAFGSQETRKLAQSSYQLLPSWSPDSARIAYQSGGRVWTVGVDGAGRRELGAGLYPSWSPDGNTVAFVQAGVIHASAARIGTGVLGVPAWSPDGGRLAFPQPDGVYVATLAGGVKRVATPAAEVRDVRFAPDGRLLAFAANGVVYDVPADGSSAPTRLAGPFRNVSPLAWSNSSDELAYTTGSALVVTDLNGGVHTQAAAKTSGIGASFAPGDPHSRVLFYSGPNPSCTGHDAIRMFQNGRVTGSCAIAGTAQADVIVGTAGGGDVIGAGAGNDTIRGRNGRRDTIDCGAGRDTVWADRIDRLAHCETVRR